MIGIFDSGIGGLTVARAVREIYPGYDIIYLGDSARSPYGSRSPETIVSHASQNIDFLVSRGAKLIVVACDVISSVAAEHVFAKFEIPIIDTLTPAAELSVQASKRLVIGIIGTRAAIESRACERKIKALKPELPISEAVIARSEHIVAMMGAEPYMQALADGADVILAGRSSDPAIFAAFCMYNGYDPGLAWHAGKILECGTAATVFRKRPDCIMAYLRKDHFIVEPLAPDARCSPQSIAAHSFYENYDPFYIQESSGLLDISQATYQAVSDRAVKVAGSLFIPQTPPTLKLEGAEFAGYQSVLIGSIRDPVIIRQIDSWMARLKEKAAERIAELYPSADIQKEITTFYHVYGKDGTMGALEPVSKTLSHELCLMVEVTAGSQEIATTIASSIRHIALHLPVPEWSGIITGFATPFSPPYIERGAIYRFNLNHVLEVEDPMEAFQLEMTSV